MVQHCWRTCPNADSQGPPPAARRSAAAAGQAKADVAADAAAAAAAVEALGERALASLEEAQLSRAAAVASGLGVKAVEGMTAERRTE